MEKQGRKIREINSPSTLAEKFAGTFAKIRQAKMINSPQLRSAEPRDQASATKAREGFQHKEFWAPKPPPPLEILMFGLFPGFCWEVLNGVGVDGIGVIFPFLRIFPLFLCIFPLFLRIFPLFLRIFLLLLKDNCQTTAIYCKNGEFHSDPVCTDPVQNFPDFDGKTGPKHKEFEGSGVPLSGEILYVYALFRGLKICACNRRCKTSKNGQCKMLDC